MKLAYYNEHEPYAAQWLRNLIAAGHIAPGEVDERDIRDVTADDLRGYVQCHFFAGIGVWSYALRRAGIPDTERVWTGSCPCQPFSSAGKRGGTTDERHLWPAFFRLIKECRPPVVLGEQVASADGLAWFDVVAVDLEDAEYAVGAVDFCAAGVGAPHIRQRLWFVGVADAESGSRWARSRHQGAGRAGRDLAGDGGGSGGLVDGIGARSQGLAWDGRAEAGWLEGQGRSTTAAGAPERVADGAGRGCGVGGHQAQPGGERHLDGSGPGSGALADAPGPRCEGGPVEGPEGDTWDEARLLGSRCGCEPGRLADAAGHGRRQGGCDADRGAEADRPGPGLELGDGGEEGLAGGVADADGGEQRPGRGSGTEGGAGDEPGPDAGRCGVDGGVGNADFEPERRRCGKEGCPACGAEGEAPELGQRLRPIDGGTGEAGGPGATNGFWRDTDWLLCRDGRWRPVRPGSFPLAHGLTARVGRLRAYGNAINAEAADEFIGAVADALEALA